MSVNDHAYFNEGYDQMEDIPLPVYTETRFQQDSKQVSDTGIPTTHHHQVGTSSSSLPVISTQPAGNNNRFDQPSRKPIPISVIDRENFSPRFQSPANGLDFMRNADQLIIQQNFDDLIQDTENRYTVKIPIHENSEAIYYATESSDSFQRLCFGSERAFNMRLYDKTDQEAMSFKRGLGCGYCTFCCVLQKMEVWVPPGELVGRVSQTWKPFKISFEICNRHEQVLYMVEGPSSFACFHRASMFQIYTPDGSTQIGSIVRQWDPLSTKDQLSLQMPSSITDNRHKALLLGCAFLLEYMFFENSQKKLSCLCIC